MALHTFGLFLVFLAVIVASIFLTQQTTFRGGEAIGGRTGGSAYSGAASDDLPL